MLLGAALMIVGCFFAAAHYRRVKRFDFAVAAYVWVALVGFSFVIDEWSSALAGVIFVVALLIPLAKFVRMGKREA